MPRGRRIAAGFAAAFVVFAFGRAWADPVAETAAGARTLYFSGADLWRHGNFVHGGLLWSPGGLEREGFTLKAVLSAGEYRYRSGALGNTTVTGREWAFQFMPGWRFQRAGLELKLFAGLDLQHHALTPDDPSSELRGGDTGARIGFDLWYEPRPGAMLAADGMLSSIEGQYALRVATGWRVFERFYLGPELAGFNCGDYDQLRIGIHATAFKTQRYEWSAAVGLAEDSDERSGAYARIGMSTRN